METPSGDKGMRGLAASLRQLALRLTSGELSEILSAQMHGPYLSRHRITSLIQRIRIVAFVFSGLTLLWIALDAITLTTAQWQALAGVRLLAIGFFLWLALLPEKERTLGEARMLLVLLLTPPMAIYGFASFLLNDTAHPSLLAAINGRLYLALPFIVLAGLSIFPLVTLEGVLIALPILGMVTAVQMTSSGYDPVSLISTIWVLALVLGVYLLACAAQLHYMMALLHRASYDPLTGALTRRSGVEVIDLQFRIAVGKNEPLAIAFVDLDKFKSINDTYGHDAGDQALRGASAALQSLLRKADTIVRWGGEEFVLVLANTDRTGLHIVMPRILKEWLGRRPDGGPLTASIGIAERMMDSAADWSELVKLADERMYQAKQTGRARCVLGNDDVLLPAAA